MGYLKIPNLYKSQEILLFKECYALEKLHGTSAHVSFIDKQLRFFSGGEKYDNFTKLFNQEFLTCKFIELGLENITIYGEAYGGKQQGMSHTYGKELKFAAFDVKIGDKWLSVDRADEVVKSLGLEFVFYKRISTDLAVIDAERDADSTQAIRNGVGVGKIREGVVLRPLIEVTLNNGERIICKHKRDEFRETKTPRPVVDPAKLEILKKAEQIADEWVTNERLNHVLDKIPDAGIENTGQVIGAMLNDIQLEAKGEIEWSKDATKAISTKTAQMFKKRFTDSLKTAQPHE